MAILGRTGNDKIGGPALSETEYEMLLVERERIDAKIKEFEQEHRRGSVKVIRTKGGAGRSVDIFSLRYDAYFGSSDHAYWRTIFSGSVIDIIEFIEVMLRDFPGVLESLKESVVADGAPDA